MGRRFCFSPEWYLILWTAAPVVPVPAASDAATQEQVKLSVGSGKVSGKVKGKPKVKQTLSLDSLNLLHAHTVLSTTTGHGESTCHGFVDHPASYACTGYQQPNTSLRHSSQAELLETNAFHQGLTGSTPCSPDSLSVGIHSFRHWTECVHDVCFVLCASGPEDSAKYNDRRMTTPSTCPFKPSTQKQTISQLEMLPALDQMLGKKRIVIYQILVSYCHPLSL